MRTGKGDVKGQKRRWKARVSASKRARRLYCEYFDIFEPYKPKKKISPKISRKKFDIPFASCTREYSAAYYQFTKERKRQNVNAWRKRNPEVIRASRQRHRTGEHILSGADLARKMRAQKGRCVYCREDIRDLYHVDHIMPLSLGGDNSPRNVQLLCPSCNCRKSNLHPVEFASRIGLLC